MKRGGEYEEVYHESVSPTVLLSDKGSVLAGPPVCRTAAENTGRSDAVGGDTVDLGTLNGFDHV